MIKRLRLFLSDKLFDVALKICDVADKLAPSTDEGWRARRWREFDRLTYDEALLLADAAMAEDDDPVADDLDAHFAGVPFEPTKLGDSLDLSAYAAQEGYDDDEGQDRR